MTRTFVRRVGLALALVASWAAASAAQVTVHRNVATLALQNGVIAIDALSNGHLLVGASTDSGTATVPLTVFQAREFTDSTRRIIAYRAPVSRREHVYTSLATADRSGAGVQFARHVTRGRNVYRFFFSREDATGFPLDVNARELRLVVDALRKAVKEARSLTAAADSSG